ncbi:hypothetical protein SLEP1_g51248 [Rubroshorea leprosula]|uniref:Uncharacterized protein n=1 Tax=Rubroshorea leprosula TaxID=152421 RepID=A0AAV5M5U3_9ROSI|nr:hypothetical protein SLEP1_g51248 [Rubroshorea leprosula]
MKRKRSNGDGQFEKLSAIAQLESKSDSDPFIVDVDKGNDKEYASNVGSCFVLGKEVEVEVQAKSKARGLLHGLLPLLFGNISSLCLLQRIRME